MASGFVGADPDPTITGVSQLAGTSNYLLGNDSSRWLRRIPNYAQVEYRNVYPSVDVSFYGNGRSLEHDFKVAPGGDPSCIAFRLNGSESIHISKAGDLEVTLPAGMLVLRKPKAYQESPAGRVQVKADYDLAANGIVRFKLGGFDKSIALVIDPVLDFATYLANDSTLYVQGVAADSSDNTYIVGQSFSASYPVTSGSFQTTCSACASNQPAIFITKLNATGTAQVYSSWAAATTTSPRRLRSTATATRS